MRVTAEFPIAPDFRSKLSAYAAGFEEFALLDSCGNSVYGENSFDYLLAAGAHAVCAPGSEARVFAEWEAFVEAHGDWIFGFLGYELNVGTESISPPAQKLFPSPPLRFFVPAILVLVQGTAVTISVHPDAICDSPDHVYHAILSAPLHPFSDTCIRLQPMINKSAYIANVERIRKHIIDGDIYELNYCQPFVAHNAELEPISVFNRLCEVSKAPFSALHRFGSQYLICGSPERFFRYDGRRIQSMPIKGTRRRDADSTVDEQLRSELEQSVKDKAEHIMIVDLVRNDLTPYAVSGTIQVDALYGIHAFPQVYQMVSTISAELRQGVPVCRAIRQAFPMGSMTGAPKVRAMEIIAEVEPFQRGMYSGAFGYFTPEGHCDFNVVIRSLLYNADTRLLAAYAGGAIVYDSVAEKELDECYVKLSGIQQVLNQKDNDISDREPN